MCSKRGLSWNHGTIHMRKWRLLAWTSGWRWPKGRSIAIQPTFPLFTVVFAKFYCMSVCAFAVADTLFFKTNNERICWNNQYSSKLISWFLRIVRKSMTTGAGKHSQIARNFFLLRVQIVLHGVMIVGLTAPSRLDLWRWSKRTRMRIFAFDAPFTPPEAMFPFFHRDFV